MIKIASPTPETDLECAVRLMEAINRGHKIGGVSTDELAQLTVLAAEWKQLKEVS